VPKLKKAGELLEILVKRDHGLVPAFYRALIESDQLHVAHMLGYEGLH